MDMLGMAPPPNISQTIQSQVMPTAQQPIATSTPANYPNGGNQYQSGSLPAQQAPQTGLIGSENALLGGMSGALGSMNQGYGSANQTVVGGVNQGIHAINAGDAASAGYLGGVASQNYSDIQQPTVNFNSGQYTNPAVSNFSPYISGGQNASKLQADLSGANGVQAQQAAYANYQSSPAMQYQMDQMNKATQQSAAAKGGLLGANVQRALQQNASGIASQDYQNQFANMGTVANQGLTASGQVGNIKNAEMNANANLAGQQYAGQMNLLSQVQQQKANAMNSLATLANQHGINISNLDTGAAQAISGNQVNQGLNTGSLYTGTGQQLAAGRTNAGNAIASNVTNTATNLGNLLNNQGIAVSGSMANDVNNISQMIHDSGLQDSISNDQLATILANIAGGKASNQVSTNQAIGNANAAGTLGVGNAISGGLSSAYGAGLLGSPAASGVSGVINSGAQ